ncbi:MAG: TIGR03546 family protein [Gemmatimonadetes bacterium]|nr:TIGR03546 family protein [Gemmatimonadota bacterium]
MLFLKLLQQLISALNSEGTPGQVAAGAMLGAALGLTPLLNFHNLLIVALAIVVNVSLPGFMLGWALFLPFGFALDPVFDRIGQALLLSVPPLTPFWTAAYNSALALTNFNNTVVLGSFVGWLVAALPTYLVFRIGVTRYRQHIYERLKRTRAFQVVTASKLYNYYRLFRP